MTTISLAYNYKHKALLVTDKRSKAFVIHNDDILKDMTPRGICLKLFFNKEQEILGAEKIELDYDLFELEHELIIDYNVNLDFTRVHDLRDITHTKHFIKLYEDVLEATRDYANNTLHVNDVLYLIGLQHSCQLTLTYVMKYILGCNLRIAFDPGQEKCKVKRLLATLENNTKIPAYLGIA